MPEGDLFSWKLFQPPLKTNCVSHYYQDRSEADCQGIVAKQMIVFDYKTDFYQAKNLCQSLGGNLPFPRSEEESKRFGKLFAESSQLCLSEASAFLGLKKVMPREVVNLQGSKLLNLTWHDTQPNGDIHQMCIGIRKDGKLNDMQCSSPFCFMCEVKTKNHYILRGNIPSGVDRHYFVELTNDQTYIRGRHSTQCSLTDSWDFGTLLSQDEKSNLFPPVGLQTWNNGTFLKFTQCRENEFTCHLHGNCISLEFRCNGYPECDDGTDESGCEVMILDPGYNMKYSPYRRETVIGVNMEIIDIFDIKELQMTFKATISFSLIWNDTRITFKNLFDSPTDNLLDSEDAHNIWSPVLSLKNSIDKHGIGKSASNDKFWSMMIMKQGLHVSNPFDEIDEDYLYPGSENSFLLTNFATVTVECNFNLTMYPFDGQTCPIKIAVPRYHFNAFNLKLMTPPKVGDLTHSQYKFMDVEYSQVNTSMSEINVRIKFRRLFSYHITNTYIPTLCLMIICQLTLFIDPAHFEANIMVAPTSMLVMYTLFQSVSATLPQTSYLKFIDVWLFFGLIMPFVIICILVKIDSWIVREKDQVSRMGEQITWKKYMKAIQVCIPMINGTICLAYWVFAIYHYCTF